MKKLSDLTEREILALAIANEEEDSRIYQFFADQLRDNFPPTAALMDEMAEEERSHRSVLFSFYKERFGDHLPPIRREDVKGFLKRRQIWWSILSPKIIRREAEIMEMQAANFYEKAATLATNIPIRELFLHLSEVERGHEKKASNLNENLERSEEGSEEREVEKRLFVLQYVQPGLAGLVDGSVSTLAPLFAAAFATQSNADAFAVGLAASLGAGVSMGLTEALSDDGVITGRGPPLARGIVCGVMTAIGGLGHTLPYFISDDLPNAFEMATGLAIIVVIIELLAISWIRTRYMATRFWEATLQVVIGGLVVLLLGILIGSA